MDWKFSREKKSVRQLQETEEKVSELFRAVDFKELSDKTFLGNSQTCLLLLLMAIYVMSQSFFFTSSLVNLFYLQDETISNYSLFFPN